VLRFAVFGALLAHPALMAGCGATADSRERDISHSAELRPGEVPAATEGERELLARLDDVPVGESVTVGGQTFVVDEPYTAASGRLCRSVTAHGPGHAAIEVKLACQDGDLWVFVPDVFGDDAPRVAEVEP